MCNLIFRGYPYSPSISCKQHLVGRMAIMYTVLQQLTSIFQDDFASEARVIEVSQEGN